MFELSLVLKYLWPKKRALSTSLISLLSIFLVTLVVWLVIVFLSVTGGIEKNWLEKLTAVHAPLKIYPTQKYYNSYYYQIDKVSSLSSFQEKNIQEKLRAIKTDPYDPSEDFELSSFFPEKEQNEKGEEKDLVKELFSFLQKNHISFQDYEVAGALMRLSFLEEEKKKVSFLSQMNYLMSFCGENPHLSSLILPPSVQDLNHLYTQLQLDPFSLHKEIPEKALLQKNQSLLQKHIFFSHLTLKKVQFLQNKGIDGSFFPENTSFSAYFNPFSKMLFLDPPEEEKRELEKKTFIKKGKALFCKEEKKNYPEETSLFFCSPQIFSARVIKETLFTEKEPSFHFSTNWEGIFLEGTGDFTNVKIEEAVAEDTFSSPPSYPPFWAYKVGSTYHLPKRDSLSGVVIPKNYQENGFHLGDIGNLSYFSRTASSQQEMRLPFYIAGFYDPGVIPIGNRFLLVPSEITNVINRSSFTPPSEEPFNGFFIWTKDLKEVDKIQAKIQKGLQEKGLLPYWKVVSYKDYPFSKSLLQQFQSDKTLFILIALIIILVACSNIVSLLILLVKEKKREIAIVKALGASTGSIFCIFGFSGAIMGILSCFLGTLAALYTLHNLDVLVSFLSTIQGHAAFQTAFFGEKLPNSINVSTLQFIWIVTPILSFFAGCIPAIQAFRVDPSKTLRES